MVVFIIQSCGNARVAGRAVGGFGSRSAPCTILSLSLGLCVLFAKWCVLKEENCGAQESQNEYREQGRTCDPPQPFWGSLDTHGGVGIGDTPCGTWAVVSSDKRWCSRVTFVFMPLERSHFQLHW